MENRTLMKANLKQNFASMAFNEFPNLKAIFHANHFKISYLMMP